MTIILTNHAKDRIKERSFDEKAVVSTVEKPDSVSSGKQKGTLEYVRKFGISKVTVIVKENEKNEKTIFNNVFSSCVRHCFFAESGYKRTFTGKCWCGAFNMGITCLSWI